MNELNKLEALLGDDLDFSGSLPEPEAEQEVAETESAQQDKDASAKDGNSDAQEQQQDAPKYKVKVDGQEQEVSLDELINGYQRQSDYTRKSQEVSRERKEIEAQKVEIEQQRSRYMQDSAFELTRLERQMEADRNIDWQSLIDESPVDYLRAKEAAEARLKQYHDLRTERESVSQEIEREKQEQQSAYRAEQAKILRDNLPDMFGDEAKSSATVNQLTQFLRESGFSDNDIEQINDAKQVMVYVNAMKFAQLQATKGQLDGKRVKQAPMRVESPGTAEAQSDSPLNKTAMESFKRSGGRDEGAALRALASLL